jgi:hypothetical protein
VPPVEAAVSDVIALAAVDVVLVAVDAEVGDGTVAVDETLVEEPQAVAPINAAKTAKQVTTVTSLRENISHLQTTDCSTSVSLGLATMIARSGAGVGVDDGATLQEILRTSGGDPETGRYCWCLSFHPRSRWD